MIIPASVLRVPAQVQSAVASPTGMSYGPAVTVMCRWEYVTIAGDSTPSDTVRMWTRPDASIAVGDKVTLNGSRLNVNRVITHPGPNGTPAALEVFAS